MVVELGPTDQRTNTVAQHGAGYVAVDAQGHDKQTFLSCVSTDSLTGMLQSPLVSGRQRPTRVVTIPNLDNRSLRVFCCLAGLVISLQEVQP
jgi:hypothetical protein